VLEQRLRKLMRREGLTYEQLSDYADVSTQAVHKWLTSGSISDEKARAVAANIGVDWLWLKHGIARHSMESLYDLVLSSTANILLIEWNSLKLVALGKDLHEKFEYDRGTVIGHCLLDFTPNLDETLVRRMQKLMFSLSNRLEFSFRATYQDKHTLKAYKLTSRGITNDEQGTTYGLYEIIEVEPDGTEDSLQSLEFKLDTLPPLNEEEVESLLLEYPEFPWLKELV